ncbi:GOLPH3/VPS74 family protein [Kribbella sp. CA-253562]|uniref:GOLPH3/VPS74 family protein n=1 Tax=Kribbella sp. CA-253562 TaxID=3239942 RepID=UPI003D8A04E4
MNARLDRRSGTPGRAARPGPPGARPDRPRQVVAASKGTVPPGLPERLYLLAFDPSTGKVANRSRLGLLLNAAALTDLHLAGRLTDEDGRVIAATGPTSSPIAEHLLAEIQAGGRKRWKHWIERRARHAVPRVRDELERGQLIKVEAYRRFGIFPAERITLRQPLVRRQLLQAATDTLRPARLVTRVDLRDAALVVLAATGELKPVLSKEQRKQDKERLAQLAVRIGPVIPALRKAIQAQNAAHSSGG